MHFLSPEWVGSAGVNAKTTPLETVDRAFLLDKCIASPRICSCADDMSAGLNPPTARRPGLDIYTLFLLSLIFNLWGVTVGWNSLNLPGGEFRQAQTAISTYYIQQADSYELAYPTPVLGKPWSIPMEFPLYQWSVAALSSSTGLELTRAGRLVGLVCFYLTLPAFYILVAQFGLGRMQRLVVLGMILTCPLYVFYARAFLIETMALMFSAWFLVAFIRLGETHKWRWLVLANIAGWGAGLVKVTTFMLFLIPAGLIALIWLWRARPTRENGGWAEFIRVVVRIAGATTLPFVATVWWIKFADGIKRVNPSARFLQSDNLAGFNFGTMQNRFSADTLSQHWHHLAENLVWPPVLLLGLGLALTVSLRWWRPILLCAGCYILVLVLFPILYALHDYYAVANGVFLLVALGIALGGLLDTRLSRGWVVGIILAVYALQAGLYYRGFYQDQRGQSAGGSGLTAALQRVTNDNDILVIAGDDWSSITPYYARRRALMLRNGMQDQTEYLREAIASLAGERVGAVVLQGFLREHNQLRERLLAAFDMDLRAVFTWQEAVVYLPVETRIPSIRLLRQDTPSGVELAGDAVIPAPGALGGEWRLMTDLSEAEQAIFAGMNPRPVGFYSSFGPTLERHDGVTWFNAHPTTRLRFHLPAGIHTLHTRVGIINAAFAGDFAPGDVPTDGVAIELQAREGGLEPRVLYQRLLDPVQNSDDRDAQLIEVTFTLSEATDIDLYFGPGPNGRDTRDWIWLRGPLVFD